MIFPPLYELSLVGVHDASIPNKERIIIRPTEACNLAAYGILLGFPNEDGTTTPAMDYFFWFGELIVEPPSWIILYTGPGKSKEMKIPESGQRAHIFHWDKPKTIFHKGGVVPILIRMDSLLVAK